VSDPAKQAAQAVFTLNFLPYKPTGPVSSNIYRPTINSTGPNLKTTLMTINVYNHMINRVGKMCVAAMSLCMIVLIVTRKRGDGGYYFAL
jgi:hypothetical protein